MLRKLFACLFTPKPTAGSVDARVESAFDGLWKSKLALQREVRNQAYSTYYVKEVALGRIASGNLPLQLFDIATKNLGDINSIRREIVTERWGIDADPIWAQREQSEYLAFIRDEQTLIAQEVRDILVGKKIQFNETVFSRGKQSLAASSSIHEARHQVLLQGFIRKKDVAGTERDRADMRWYTGIAIEFITALLLVFTAYLSWLTFTKDKAQFHLQNRPFVVVEREGEVKPPPSREKMPDGQEAVLWTMKLKNYGSLPAYQVSHFAVWMMDNQALGRLNAPDDFNPASLHWNPNSKVAISKNLNFIIPPNGHQTIRFLMPKSTFYSLVNAGNKEVDGVIQSGITFQVNYAGPWDKEGTRPYYYQHPLYLWNNGSAGVGYGTRSPRAN